MVLEAEEAAAAFALGLGLLRRLPMEPFVFALPGALGLPLGTPFAPAYSCPRGGINGAIDGWS